MSTKERSGNNNRSFSFAVYNPSPTTRKKPNKTNSQTIDKHQTGLTARKQAKRQKERQTKTARESKTAKERINGKIKRLFTF